ncbi:MAG TPA: peptide ABC transporter substrate-binding protein [Pyrinomonadaceae bacterium]|nr:peptide ABC transporter substrate-binding protein [Pyrinomonadaceae bacterium]
MSRDPRHNLHARRRRRLLRLRGGLAFLLCLMLVTGGCFESEEAEQFYGKVNVPRAQEFRWSDGGLPQTFDPALAAAPPDTDVVRAMYEGLTDYEPRTLEPVAGVAARWEASADGRRWTFHLRRDARWSNGDAVTAHDFVKSWRRTLAMRERAPHAKLLDNIEGARALPATVPPPPHVEGEAAPNEAEAKDRKTEATRAAPTPSRFGAEAIDDYTLVVRLQRPDKNFPALVAHPVFRPVHEAKSSEGETPPELVTNGAFRLSARGTDAVMLERAKTYWDAASVGLERVRFVAARDAEEALAAYRAGEVDAVTNAAFGPLAVKLLTPYKDFRRDTYGALTYYSFNTARAPFADRRIREALAAALDLERLSKDTLGGSTEPARKFFPARVAAEASADEKNGVQEAGRVDAEARPLKFDPARARQLLAEAGFPNGANFPRIRLLVNRNDQHRLVAQAVAAMWRNVLGVQTDILVRSWDEYEQMLRAGDYDIARRSMVMQTTDEETNMLALFAVEEPVPLEAEATAEATPSESAAATTMASPTAPDGSTETTEHAAGGVVGGLAPRPAPLLTEAEALRELPAIPIYFASSYALVKPYVVGFDANLLDAPSLKHVRVDTNWKPPPRKGTVSVESVGGR